MHCCNAEQLLHCSGDAALLAQLPRCWSGEARESPSSCLPRPERLPSPGPLAACPLQKFYSDPDRYAYSFQHYVLLSRVQEVGGRSRRTVGWQGLRSCTAADCL